MDIFKIMQTPFRKDYQLSERAMKAVSLLKYRRIVQNDGELNEEIEYPFFKYIRAHCIYCEIHNKSSQYCHECPLKIPIPKTRKETINCFHPRHPYNSWKYKKGNKKVKALRILKMIQAIQVPPNPKRNEKRESI